MTKDMKIQINSYAQYPIYISTTPDTFGEMFASFSDDEQIECLKSIVHHMGNHPTQWDYIAMKLDLEEYADVNRKLKDVFGGE